LAALRRPLSLHQLTALELTPVELIDLAAELECSHVGLFTCLPQARGVIFPCVATDEQEAAVKERLSATGVRVNNAEVFSLHAGSVAAQQEDALSRAARLGARMATVHVHEQSPEIARSLLRDFCDLAAAQDLRVALEFTSFSATRSLSSALQLLEDVSHPAACLAVDALHFFRNGGSPAQLIPVPAELIGYLQLCDGWLIPPGDLYHEAVAERCVPGIGDFPLVELLASMDASVMVDVEVPRETERINGCSAAYRAAVAVEATRNLLLQAS